MNHETAARMARNGPASIKRVPGRSDVRGEIPMNKNINRVNAVEREQQNRTVQQADAAKGR
jgi:hypothetical protein